ncbi:hypothetical protein AYO40_04560 [Planctomycetaceae bacterium SCGC AG-212-D15]|nr:hypothetical protein AYO40_04560 [Planctomycetaceae bacterium SCGC AG-212-D15]
MSDIGGSFVHRWFVRLGVLLMLAAIAGCGATPRSPITGATVTGSVRYQGNLVTGGTVRLVGVDDANLSMIGPIDGHGNYRVVNAPLGEMKVVIETESARTDLRNFFKKAPSENAPAGPPLKYVKIDPKYSDPNQTDLRITVEGGEQAHDIDLR